MKSIVNIFDSNHVNRSFMVSHHKMWFANHNMVEFWSDYQGGSRYLQREIYGTIDHILALMGYQIVRCIRTSAYEILD